MQKADVRYLSDPDRTDRLVIHPADEMRAKRDLAGKSFADSEYRLYYNCWLASKRTGLVDERVGFDAWLADVAEVEPILTEKLIKDALAMGTVDEKGAEHMRAEMERQEAACLGESPTRHTPSQPPLSLPGSDSI